MALFAGLYPLWTIVTAFLFAGLLVGGTSMQVTTGVPSDLVTAINGSGERRVHIAARVGVMAGALLYGLVGSVP